MFKSIFSKIELLCPSCGSRKIRVTEKEKYCSSCGTVFDDYDSE